MRDIFIRVEFNITGENAKTHFDQLREQYEEQASVEFGSDLVWDKHDTRIVCLVHLSKEADIRNQKAWEFQFQWFQEK